ncbi:MAG: hypothetical protein WC998_03250 [Candidatus Paceibacterota bacterium]|jgi:hypothetical protein
MGLFDELREMQAMSPKERIIHSLENRRGKTDPKIRNLQMHVIAKDIARYMQAGELGPNDLAEIPEEEKKELMEILERWANEKSPEM